MLLETKIIQNESKTKNNLIRIESPQFMKETAQ